MKKFSKIIWQGNIKIYRIFILILILNLLILDQISKYLVRFYLENPINITSFFRIIFVENKGMAFSLPINKWFVFCLAFCVVIYLGSFLWKRNISRISVLAYCLIIAGTIGNICDRIFYKTVTDFLSFWNFPIFNLADSFIFIGVCLVIWGEFFQKPI